MPDRSWLTVSFLTPLFFRYHPLLKVPSDQIGSACEWYHWIGLTKDIKVSDFIISVLNIWKDFKVLSRFIQKWIQPPACWDHSLHRIISPYLLSHFYLLKKSAKWLLYFRLDCGLLVSSNILLTSRNPKNNCWLSRICGARFGEKRLRFVPMQPIQAFLHEAAQNFEVFSNIQKWNKKI